MNKIIRIGTRDSELALWQANVVKIQLEALGYQTEIISIKATGDIVLDKPLYEIGVVGVFTRNLDIALLNEEIDIAVHSLKDVPTVLPAKIVQAAVLKRGNYNDVLVFKTNEEFLAQKTATVATGSLRRKAQWLHRYPNHTVVDLRGNVNTRLQKLNDNHWDGAIFASAGLNRIKKMPENNVTLNWMLPAPAQGAIMITALEENTYSKDACGKLNDKETEICTTIERDFLNFLEGGCTAPIGALALIKNDKVSFKGALYSKDGTQKIEVTKTTKLGEEHTIARYCAGEIIERGGKRIMVENEGLLSKKATVFSTKMLSIPQAKLFHDDIEVKNSDFIKIRFNRIAPKYIKQEIEHVIITSKNAVDSLLTSFSTDELQFKNIYCVGRRTKRLIENRIGSVQHSEKNAQKLATYLSETIKGQEVTYFCSDLRLDTLPKILTENGITVNEVEAYKTMFSPMKVGENIQGVLFFSPSTVESYFTENKADKIAFCIGESTAAAARKYFKKVKVAKLPTVESVIELVNLHYVKK